jgi:hypothetical protein
MERRDFADRHGVIDHRKLEHLRDVAPPRRQRRDVSAVEQDFSARGSTMPDMRLSSVVLPQPLGPSSAYAPPCRQVIEIGFNAKDSTAASSPL